MTRKFLDNVVKRTKETISLPQPDIFNKFQKDSLPPNSPILENEDYEIVNPKPQKFIPENRPKSLDLKYNPKKDSTPNKNSTNVPTSKNNATENLSSFSQNINSVSNTDNQNAKKQIKNLSADSNAVINDPLMSQTKEYISFKSKKPTPTESKKPTTTESKKPTTTESKKPIVSDTSMKTLDIEKQITNSKKSVKKSTDLLDDVAVQPSSNIGNSNLKNDSSLHKFDKTQIPSQTSVKSTNYDEIKNDFKNNIDLPITNSTNDSNISSDTKPFSQISHIVKYNSNSNKPEKNITLNIGTIEIRTSSKKEKIKRHTNTGIPLKEFLQRQMKN